MTQFFIGLYDYFERHKILFYLSLISCVLLMGFFALQVSCLLYTSDAADE